MPLAVASSVVLSPVFSGVLSSLSAALRVRVAHAVAGREVLLVERDRLLAAAAEPAQRLRAREHDPGAVGELAGAREEGVGVAVLAALVGAAAEREQLAPDVLLVLVLLHRLGDRGLGLGVGGAGRLQRRVRALELAHRARGDRAVDAVGDELGLDLVEQVEVHLQRGHRGAGRAHGERAVLGRGRLARDERGRGAVAGVALDAEQALDGQRRSAQRGRRRERGDDVLRGLGRGSLRGVLAHGRQASPTRATRSSDARVRAHDDRPRGHLRLPAPSRG